MNHWEIDQGQDCKAEKGMPNHERVQEKDHENGLIFLRLNGKRNE